MEPAGVEILVTSATERFSRKRETDSFMQPRKRSMSLD